MPRRRRAERRQISGDPRYNSEMVTRFINRIMMSGKKSVAERIVYSALEIASKGAGRPPIEVLDSAVHNATPILEVKPRRVGGATYQVPIEIRTERRTSLAVRWLVNAARGRKGKPIAEGLAQEFLDASKGQGAAVKRREDIHRMAEANRAFVHYRW